MPKVRFVILQSGAEKQLFSVEERASGDLTFGLPHYAATRFEGRSLPSPIGRKLSVHLSPNSDPPAHTITHEIMFRSRQSHKGHAVVKRRNGLPFIWPLFIQAVGKVAKPLGSKPSVAKDEIFPIVAYDAHLDTLMMAVFISDPDFEFPPACGLSIASRKFTHFRVTVLYNFATIPSPTNCFEEVVHTSSVIGTGSARIQTTRNSTYSEVIDFVEPFLIERFVPLANMIRARRSSILLPPNGADVQMVRFPRNPQCGFTAEEFIYGANPILSTRRNAIGRRMAPPNGVTKRMFATGSAAPELGRWTLRRGY
jgi:hypothetical protein